MGIQEQKKAMKLKYRSEKHGTNRQKKTQMLRLKILQTLNTRDIKNKTEQLIVLSRNGLRYATTTGLIR